ncbi:YjbH domain-containing protein [Vibrio natriegens]|uniref:YjbH domain-containing protein n=1 Tax=Vibrio natriegens TaxID=691 RepID=UPI001EFE6A8C|nr:YjbH domain-containing protein [Vibrio natriegens]MCG9701196.1 YjbH domain-containing protein [Vibrio natriegens]
MFKPNYSLQSCITAVLLLGPCTSFASPDNLSSYQSFTGLGFTPNAQVIDTGDFHVSFSQGAPYKGSIAQLDNWFFGAGILPGVEAGGRIVTQTYDCNHYFDQDCGIRDLSASFKAQVPYIYDFTGIQLAIGAQDVGGAASKFRSAYVVADKTFEDYGLRFSTGYGKSDLSLGIIDGPFGGVEWQPLPFTQLVGEYDASEFNVTAKVFTPEGFLPYGIQTSAHVELYTGHQSSEQTLWGINTAIPLLGYSSNSINSRKRLKLAEQETTEQRLASELAESKSTSLTSLQQALKNEGFINIQTGTHLNQFVVALENRRYNHNEVDGVGVALGLIATNLSHDTLADMVGSSDAPVINVLLLNNNIPVMRVSTTLDCYQDFLATGELCKQTSFSSKHLNEYRKQTQWIHQNINEGIGRSQLIFAPIMNYNVATEYGVFDYSVGLSSNLYTPLWQGAAFDIRHVLPLDDSDDYESGGLWENQSLDNEINRVLIHQAFRLPIDIMTQFSAGYIYGGYLGGMNETQWNSPEGNHGVSFQISEFTYKDDVDSRGRQIEDKATRLANYTYSKPDWNWQLSLRGGEYWFGDKGFDITTTHWLGDAKFFAKYLSSEDEEFLTLGVALPLTPWRDMKPGYLQVRGIDQYELTVQTRINDSHNNVNTGLGQSIELQHSLEREYLNRSRLTPAYFNTNQQRMRNAYIRLLEQEL